MGLAVRSHPGCCWGHCYAEATEMVASALDAAPRHKATPPRAHDVASPTVLSRALTQSLPAAADPPGPIAGLG